MGVNTFIVPAYNEEANLPRLITDLESRPELWRGGRLIIVDDGSDDATADVAEAYDGPLPVEVLRQIPNQGPGRAFDRGFRHALATGAADDLIITLEGDTTSDLDALTKMIPLARDGNDVVLASHHAGGSLDNVSAHRKLLSKIASAVIRRAAGMNARTVSSFFRVYRAASLEAAYDRYGDTFIREGGFACKAEILIKLDRMGAQVAEVPVSLDWSKREGESTLRVIPTVTGYARLMMRQVTARSRA
jgi:dolichol-phosphate mannosyltransferase